MEQLMSPELIAKIMVIFQAVCMAIGVITLVATAVVRITPTKTDDERMSKIAKFVVKALHWLPTIGINPQTKKLEETIMELREATNAGVPVEPTKNS